MNWVTPGYGQTVNWEILEGRDFSDEFSTDSTAIILNEAAANFIGHEDLIGESITHFGKEYKIIGIVKNLLTESPFQSEVPAAYLTAPADDLWFFLVRLNPDMGLAQSLASIKSIFKELLPNEPFQYEFVSEAFSGKFRAEERMGMLTGIFAILAIIISCLGLFGLTMFVIEQRTKEIGIRKVLGSTVLGIYKLLSKDFITTVLLSCSIAMPVAYVVLDEWLANYEYRIQIQWWTFAMTLVGVLIITLLTVSIQTIKATFVNPVETLKDE